MFHEQLSETVTEWLAKVRNTVGKGTLDPNKKVGVTRVLGALMAMSNPDIADALNEKGDLGTVLYSVGGENKQDSNAALQRLAQLGRHPSVKSFTEKAAQVIDDPDAATLLTKQVQGKIDQVMRKTLAQERQRAGKQGDDTFGLMKNINKQAADQQPTS